MQNLSTADLAGELDELEAREDDADEPLDDDERERLAELRKLAETVEDWEYGATLIHEDNFAAYAREFAEDVGAVPDNAAWPLNCIDWEQAAHELSADYTSVDFDGESYYVR